MNGGQHVNELARRLSQVEAERNDLLTALETEVACEATEAAIAKTGGKA